MSKSNSDSSLLNTFSDRPNHLGLLDRVGGTLELGCNPPRRTLQNQTKGRKHSGSCGESKSQKGVNPD